MREFFQKPAGKIVAIVLVVLALGVAGYSVYTQSGASSAGHMSADRVFIDSTTGKQFEYVLKVGETLPITAPSGQKTGFQAEACYWTKDGKPKAEPTFVLVNARMGKLGPTFCPDCGRLVVLHNPPAGPNVKPPPLKSEYNERQSTQSE